MKPYPNLFQEAVWPSGPTSVQFMDGERPPDNLVSNVNAVPVTLGGQFVVIQLVDGAWEIPGGTVEPNESPIDALARELLEEAGARLDSAAYIGAWQMISHAEKPFRPHMPYPVAYRTVYRCKVTLVSKPKIPDEGGEQVVLVKTMRLQDAMQCFESADRKDLAELYQYATEFNTYSG